MSTLKTRLLGLAATLGLLAFVVGTPALLIAIDALPSTDSFSWTVLRSPDDGTLAMAVIGVLAWAAWAVMTASLTLEALARLRGVHAPQLPGFGVPQLAAGRLVATAALLFIATPLGTQASPAPAPPVADVALTLATAPVTPIPHETRAVETSTQQATPPVTVSYLTKRGDSLWKIAEEHLGDGRRYVEIVALNTEVINGRPDFLPVGLTLRLPAPDPANSQTHVVNPGDTLSEIADETLGDPMRYPELFEATQNTIQPDGQRLTDPDLIRPGWRITIPNTSSPNISSPDTPSPEVIEPERPTKNQDETPGAEETKSPSETATAEPAPRDTAQEVDDEGTQVPGWLLPGLTGGGAVLAGAVLLVVRAHRRTQLRHRRPGHVIALPPPELLAVEKTLQVTGTPMLPRIEKVDDLLRHLRATMDEIPALNTVELTADAATLHLAEPTDLPAPWHGAGTRWAAPLDTDVPIKPDEPAPYPLLVTVGQGDDGHPWLLNLEQLQNVAITGEPTKAEALGRYLVAELSLNPWSSRVDVIALGIGHELDALSHRLTHHAADEDGVLAKLEDYLTGDNRFDGLDPEIFHAVITAGEPTAVATTMDLIAQHPWRPGAAVVTINKGTGQDAVEIQVMPEGRLQIPALGLDLITCGLTTEEAAVCAAIVDVTRDAENTPMPIEGSPTDELEGLIDSSGAVRRDFTEPRPNGPARNDSLLPLASEEYEANSSTVAEDIDVLAPVTPLSTRRRVEDADPTLDDDVAAWLGNEPRRPRITLLGPVGARAYGDPSVVARRKPFYVEMLAFLALHPGGATSQQVADAFSITTGRARNDLSKLRGWLGDDPRTGQRYLPPAERNGKYRVDGVLSDLDLFRRLRARGQARGANGVCDLVSALSLVTGEPFSDVRETGWNWLLEGERLDHVMTCAIVDVGHIVTTHALTTHDLDVARTAAEASYLAAPYDEIAQLDLIEVAAKTGHTQVAERHLADRIFNRSDDGLGPIEVPPRTAKIVGRRRGDRGRWSSQADAAPRS